MLDFRRGKGLCKSICHHVISRTEYKTDFAVFDDPANKIESNVNVFGVWVVLVIFCKHDCRLVVQEQGSGLSERTENLLN